MWGVARGLKELMRVAQRAKSLPDVRPRRQRANLYSNYDASIDIRRSIKGGHLKAVFPCLMFYYVWRRSQFCLHTLSGAPTLAAQTNDIVQT